MSKPITIYKIQQCDLGYTPEQIQNGECEIWNRKKKGCSKCSHFKERVFYSLDHLIGEEKEK